MTVSERGPVKLRMSGKTPLVTEALSGNLKYQPLACQGDLDRIGRVRLTVPRNEGNIWGSCA